VIPHTLHRIWLTGSPPMPEAYECYWEGWQRLHPSWSFETWLSAPGDLRNRAEFYGTTSLASRSDILRYEVLLRYGGVYIDCDVECLRPIDELLEDVRAFAGYEDTTWIGTAVLGAEPGHPAFERLVKALPASVKAHPNAEPTRQTGPQFVTETWKQATLGGDADGLTLFSPPTFYPYLGWKERDPGSPYPGYAVHRWAGSWL